MHACFCAQPVGSTHYPLAHRKARGANPPPPNPSPPRWPHTRPRTLSRRRPPRPMSTSLTRSGSAPTARPPPRPRRRHRHPLALLVRRARLAAGPRDARAGDPAQRPCLASPRVRRQLPRRLVRRFRPRLRRGSGSRESLRRHRATRRHASAPLFARRPWHPDCHCALRRPPPPRRRRRPLYRLRR